MMVVSTIVIFPCLIVRPGIIANLATFIERQSLMLSIVRKYHAAFSGLSRGVWIISTALFVNRSGAMVLPFLTLYFRKELHFTDAQSGILLSSYGIAAIAGTLLGGKITSRIGGIRTQYISLATTPLVFLLLGRATHFAEVAFYMALLALTAEAARPAATTATTQFAASENHTKALALNRMAVNLGTTFGPFVGGLLATMDFHLLFAFNAIAIELSLLLLFCNFGLAPISRRHVGRRPENHAVVPTSPWRDGQFMLVMFWTLVTAIVFFQLLCTYPLYLQDVYHLSEFHIGMLMAINTIVIVLFEMVLIDYVRRFNIFSVIAIGSLLSCVGLGMMSFGTGFVFCAITVLVWTMGEMLAMPLTAAYVARSSSDENRGEYMGVYTSTYAIALVIAPIIWMSLYRINVQYVCYASLLIGIVVFFGLQSFNWAPVIKRPALD